VLPYYLTDTQNTGAERHKDKLIDAAADRHKLIDAGVDRHKVLDATDTHTNYVSISTKGTSL